MSKHLILSGIESTSLSASQEAQDRRDELVLAAAKIRVVTCAEEAGEAAQLLSQIKTFTRSIEDSRATVKAPVLDLGKRIDAVAKEITLAADEQATRLSKLVGNYNAEQARIAEAKRQEALAEERRIMQEEQAKLNAAEEAGASDRKLERMEEKAFGRLAVAKADTAAAVAPKIAGIATRPEVCFVVEDIALLYKSFPQLVKLEPNNQAIKAILKNSPGGLPGVRHWTENKAIVR